MRFMDPDQEFTYTGPGPCRHADLVIAHNNTHLSSKVLYVPGEEWHQGSIG